MVLVLIGIVLIAVLTLVSGIDTEQDRTVTDGVVHIEQTVAQGAGRSHYVIIDGMPCLQTIYASTVYGLTCDWTKWDGMVEDGEIRIAQ